MPAYNQNVYQRMLSRGANFNDPRVQRRLGNRSFQANQGTLAKGQWSNQDAMKAQWPQQAAQRPAPGPGGGVRPNANPNRGGGGNPGSPTLQAASAAMPQWKQQKSNAAQFGGAAMARPQLGGPQGGKGGPMGAKG